MKGECPVLLLIGLFLTKRGFEAMPLLLTNNGPVRFSFQSVFESSTYSRISAG